MSRCLTRGECKGSTLALKLIQTLSEIQTGVQVDPQKGMMWSKIIWWSKGEKIDRFGNASLLMIKNFLSDIFKVYLESEY